MTLLLSIPAILFAAAVSVPILVFLVECLAALKPPPRRAVEADRLARPRLAVIVPAHDEEAGLGATLKALKAQLVPGDRVVVVADNCQDATAEVARAAGVECVERDEPDRRGKGYALAAGMEALRSDQPAVVVVIDADCLVKPRSLGRLAAAAAAANAPVQCVYLLEPEPDAAPAARLSNFAFLVKNLVRQRGMMVLGQPALLQGTGMAFPWMVIDTAQLATGHITEDLVIGLDMLERGHSPRFCDTARVTSPQASPKAEVAQRKRWEHGYLLTMIRRAPRLIRRGLAGRPELLGSAADLLVPPLSLLLMLYAASVVLLGVAAGVSLLSEGPWAGVVVGVLGWQLLLGLAFAVVIAVICRVFARGVMPLGTLLAVPLYAAAKLPIYFSFMRSRETNWVRTDRAGSGSGSGPGSDSGPDSPDPAPDPASGRRVA